MDAPTHGETVGWSPATPRFRVLHLVLFWLVAAIAVLFAGLIVPGVTVGTFGDALAAAAVIAALNAVLAPIVAALRLPFTLASGFVIVLALDALILELASDISPHAISVDSFGWALLAALVISAAIVVLQVILGANDDDTYSLRVIARIARRQGGATRTDTPGLIFLEIDGLALPVLQRAMRDGSVPELARWVESGTHRLAEWETDLSSQTGASQAGILLGSNDDIPAFRWVDKERQVLVACSSPQDCAQLARRHDTGSGLLANGRASPGDPFSRRAHHPILPRRR